MASRAFYYYAGEPFEGTETAVDAVVNAHAGDMSTADKVFVDLHSAPVNPPNS